MEMRTYAGKARSGKWERVKLEINHYEGKVYSLSVEPTEDGRRLYVADNIVVGNSIYGFRGADAEAVPNIIKRLDAKVLPLSITYRCPKSHVRLAQELVPTIEAADDAIEGLIEDISFYEFSQEAKPGDLVLCRCNAPLVAPAFSLIRRGVKAVILGRDIGKSLMALVKKVQKKHKVITLTDTLAALEEYSQKEITKLLAAKKTTRATSLEDRVETILALSDGCETVSELERKTEEIFSDDAEGVTFSSVHKAKGGQAERVFILAPHLMPHPRATQEWEIEQEKNIIYVSKTRATKELYFVI